MKIRFGLTAKITTAILAVSIFLTIGQAMLTYTDTVQLYESNLQEKYGIYTITMDSVFENYFSDNIDFNELDNNYVIPEEENFLIFIFD